MKPTLLCVAAEMVDTDNPGCHEIVIIDHFSQARVAAETPELYQSRAPTPHRASAR
jgi:hypothetical protein